MDSHTLDRRGHDRRASLGGGRRTGDRTGRLKHSQPCPSCRATSGILLAGEAEGGWWFVCGHCDQMWDERARIGSRPALAS
jgi:hypothetical protein